VVRGCLNHLIQTSHLNKLPLHTVPFRSTSKRFLSEVLLTRSNPGGWPTTGRDAPVSTFASVIVIAHDRRQYLKQAVDSVLTQSIGRSRYEIIVVKNFRDEQIDRFLSQAGAQSILCEAASLDQKASEGFTVSKGDVLLFLDDDDLFEANRLEVVLSEFDNHPELGFYKNEVNFIDADGATLSRDQARSHGIHAPNRTPRLLLEGDSRYSGALRLAMTSPEFNSSSMAIRRELFEAGMPYLPRMVMGLDTLLWFEGLASDRALLLDNQRLTQYRIHSSNYSVIRGQSRLERENNLFRVSCDHDRDYRVVREFVVSTGRAPAIRQVDARILANRLTMLLRDPGSTRLDFLRLYLEVLGYHNTAPIWRSAAEFLGSVLYLVAPKSSRKAYQRRMGAG
jgi:glycosyltransferase involved in cell wall biosynthesis